MILDTNGLSALANGESTLEPILREAAEVALPVIVLGEFRYGVRQSRDRQRYEQWLTESLGSFRILDAVDCALMNLKISGCHIHALPGIPIWA